MGFRQPLFQLVRGYFVVEIAGYPLNQVVGVDHALGKVKSSAFKVIAEGQKVIGDLG